MRVYLPATLPLLHEWLAAGAAPAGRAYAVTPGLREWYADGDTEEMELAATVLAGRQALRLLADGAAPARRIVVAAEVADPDVVTEVPGAEGGEPADDEGSVIVGTPVPVASWAAIMVDDVDADTARTVARAAERVALADAGDEDADLDVGDADDLDLLWWGVQEADQI